MDISLVVGIDLSMIYEAIRSNYPIWQFTLEYLGKKYRPSQVLIEAQ